MSWFDTKGIASFAKSALKEAQKTLDKALDINVEDEEIVDDVTKKLDKVSEVIENRPAKQMGETSVWGSFSGSYFEINSSKSKSNSPVHITKPSYLFPNGTKDNSLPAPLATPENELTPIDNTTGFPSKYTTVEELLSRQQIQTAVKEDLHLEKSVTEGDSEDLVKVNLRQKSGKNDGAKSNTPRNRISVISVESESKKSSESVEVLGSAGTSPDSDIPSISTSSSIGLRITPTETDSIEVVDSLTSPGSLEIISESNLILNSIETVPSSVTSPVNSTASVEVIEDLDDEISVAESYTSLSESTGTTMFSNIPRLTDSCMDLSQASSRFRSGDSTPDVLRLSLPSHGSCDLLSESIQEVNWENSQTSSISHVEPIHHHRPHSSHGSPVRRLLSKTDEKSIMVRLDANKSEMASRTLVESSEGGSSLEDSQNTVVTIDSSCEGTLMGSSCEESTSVDEIDKKETEHGDPSSATSSCYMKELLAEAIHEDSFTRETSPTLSEKSRSDVVKVGSEQTSGHTSGDELETTTSSDIEIISSPNGDSSSNASRYSPAKHLSQGSRNKLSLVAVDLLGRAIHGKPKGHQREPSEASSEENFLDHDRSSKRINELTEHLEAREAKLVELNKSYHELQEKNLALKKQVETACKSHGTDSEKDEIIKELRDEGEKLSKTQLKQSTLIKSLRSKEQTLQTTVNNFKKQVDNLSSDLESTKKRLAAKEELEKSQSDKISLLSSKVGRHDEEMANLLSQLEQAVIKAEQLRLSLDNTESELEAKRKAVTILQKELTDAKRNVEAAETERTRYLSLEKSAQSTKAAFTGQLEELRLQLQHSEQLNSQREAAAREEKKQLLRRLEEAESRNEELAQSVSVSTRPLLRQLESLQNNATQQRESWEQRERDLLDKLEETEAHLRELKEGEKGFKQEVHILRTKTSTLENQLLTVKRELETERNAHQESLKQLADLQEQLLRTKNTSDKEMDSLRLQLNETKRDLQAAENELVAQRQALALQQLAKEKEREEENREQVRESSPQSSPTLSFGRVSVSESLSSSHWPQFNDEAFETASSSGRLGNIYDSVRVGSSSVLEGLQAQLKMREGEIAQMQWELHRRDGERSALTTELASLTARLEDQEESLKHTHELAVTLQALQRNYDALLQMHGEKVEEVEELRLDLQDVKEMYKAQIDQLLGRTSKQGEPPG